MKRLTKKRYTILVAARLLSRGDPDLKEKIQTDLVDQYRDRIYQFMEDNTESLMDKYGEPRTVDYLPKLKERHPELSVDELSRRYPSFMFKPYVVIDLPGSKVLKKFTLTREEIERRWPTSSKGRGRPESKKENLEIIRKIWKRKCEGKKFSKNQQAHIIYNELIKTANGPTLEFCTILRHYLPEI